MHFCDHALSVVRPSSLTFHIFEFSSETATRNLTKLDRKQDLNVLYQVCVFRADRKNKMAALASDWPETYSTFPLKPLNGIQRNLTGSKISTSSTKFVFFGPIGKTRWPPWPISQKGGTLYSSARYVALWASGYQNTAEFYDNHIFLNLDLYILTRTWVETTLCFITCYGKREKFFKNIVTSPFHTKSYWQYWLHVRIYSYNGKEISYERGERCFKKLFRKM